MYKMLIKKSEQKNSLMNFNFLFKFLGGFSAINYYYFKSDGTWDFQEFITTTDVPYIVYKVKAANKTQIALLYDPKHTDGEIFSLDFV